MLKHTFSYPSPDCAEDKPALADLRLPAARFCHWRQKIGVMLEAVLIVLIFVGLVIVTVGAGNNALASEPSEGLEPIQQVQNLARDASMVRAFEEMRARHDTTIAEMITLNEIPAPPFAESERATVYADMLSGVGLKDVGIDEVGNVTALRPGSVGARTVAVIAHIDTVFPAETDVRVQVDGGVYSAPGIGDNARGLALMLSMAEALEAAGIQTRDNLLFVGSVGEEGLGDLRGVRHLFGPALADQPIDSAIVIDGGNVTRIVTQAVGSNRYRITFSGPGGHSYGQFGRANPHQALASAINEFTKVATDMVGKPGAKATFSVGRIGGGTSINSIPFESWFEVDMRSTDPVRLAELDEALRIAVQRGADSENMRRTAGTDLKVEVSSVGKRPAGSLDEGEPLVIRAMAAQRVFGLEPSLSSSSTDANIPIAMGIPAVTISRGGKSRNAHAPNESWEDIDTHVAEKFALLLVVAEAGLSPDP